MPICKTLLPLTLLLSTAALAQKTPIQITADLSDATRKLYHAEIDLSVKAGPLTLTTPQWIPGNHRPTGPVDDITGVAVNKFVWIDIQRLQYHDNAGKRSVRVETNFGGKEFQLP